MTTGSTRGGPSRTERRRTLARLADLTGDYAGIVEASRDSNADDEHDPEGATIAFERSQVGALVRQAERHLAEVDAALARLDARRPTASASAAARHRVGPAGGPAGRADLRRLRPRRSGRDATVSRG